MRAPDHFWACFLLSIAKGQTGDIQDWREVIKPFGATATEIEIAKSFLCPGPEPHGPFPLGRQ
jgi:hypothetical protein